MYLLVLITLSTISYSTLGSQTNNYFNITSNPDSFTNIFQNDFNDKIKFQGSGYDYTPIASIIFNGSTFSTSENMDVEHSIITSTKYVNPTTRSASLDIPAPTGYSDVSLDYNITNIVTIEDYYRIEEVGTAPYELNKDQDIALAQEFEVFWDYAIFTGANMTFDNNRVGDFGTYQMDLFIVNSTGSAPNVTDVSNVLSYCLSSPFNESNYSILDDTMKFYDFEDIILVKGKYFVVANLTVIDSGNDSEFIWGGKTGTKDSETYFRDNGGSWSAGVNVDLSLFAKLLPSDESGFPLTITDPTTIELEDDGSPVSSLTGSITSGSHTLTSNTSVQISYENNYVFQRLYVSNSEIMASNSSYLDYTNQWNVSFDIIEEVDTIYTNINRTLLIPTPDDWESITFSLYWNSSLLYSERVNDGYEFYLNDSIYGGSFVLRTESPNYIQNPTFSDDVEVTENYVLGTWTPHPTGDNATGIPGSTIFTEAGVKNISTSGGTFNFTLFNSNGEIIQQKNYTELLTIDLIYNDVSNYSGIGYIDGSVYKHNITIDPSVYGTDVEGYWTAVVFWQNGTEVGMFSKRIAVEKPTLAEFEWEETLGLNDWTNDTFVELKRINGHGIDANIKYYNTSDPFFTGVGSEIPSAIVYYNATWGDSGLFNFGASEYNKDIMTNALIGTYNISLTASGPFLETHTIEFSIKIIHQFDINPERNNYYVNYTNSLNVRFGLRDISYGNELITPDTLDLVLNGNPLTLSNYSYGYTDNLIDILLNTNSLGLDIGDHELEITVTKNDFVADYGVISTSTSTTITVTEIPTMIEVVDIETELDINTQSSLSFKIIDTNHSADISGASFDVIFDLPEVELIEKHETNGIYTITFRVNEPTKATLNIYLNITKSGYETKLNYRIPEAITIDIPGPGIPLGVLVALIAVAVVIGGGAGTFFFLRARRRTRQRLLIEKKEKARNLFQSAFMIRKILVVHHETSLPVYEMSMEENIGLDSSMITGVLQAISSIGMEMIGAPTGVKKIEYYGFVVTSAYSGAYTSYVFSETELDPEIVKGVSNLAKWFDVIFGYDSEQWDGSMDLFNEYKDTINEKVFQELYLWLVYPIELAPDTMRKYESFSPINKMIVDFINSKEKTTVMVLLDNINDFDDEVILSNIIELVKKEMIITHTND